MKRKKLTQLPGDKLEAIAPALFKERHIEFVTQNAAQVWLQQGKIPAIRYLMEYSRSEWVSEIHDAVIDRVAELYNNFKENEVED